MDDTMYGWTEPLATASLRADPSGIQDTGTVVQAWLLPGMSTVTPNVRYVSLFSAAQYWRHHASKQGHAIMDYRVFLRRFEALVALSSVLHHDDTRTIPTGVVGRRYANAEALRHRLTLNTGVKVPAYGTYRGTLGDLGLFDLTSRDDPLFDSAKSIGGAWNVEAAGSLGDQIKEGRLPETMSSGSLKSVADCFCLCRVPDKSDEQHALVVLLFGLDQAAHTPSFAIESWDARAIRVASWRLLLDIVLQSPERNLYAHYLMGRLLEADLLDNCGIEALRNALFLWRWVAARSFFELGWTVAFNQAFDLVRSSSHGVGHADLLSLVRDKYCDDYGSHKLADLTGEAEANRVSGLWMAETFDAPTTRNCLLLMACGALASRDDLNRCSIGMLHGFDSGRQIPFQLERERMDRAVHNQLTAAEYWAEIVGETLVQHSRIALRKMAQGLPDTQHVEFEDGYWVVPPNRDSWTPRPSTGFSRFDIALGWLCQLGLADTDENGSYPLTEYGRKVPTHWDEVYKSWG